MALRARRLGPQQLSLARWVGLVGVLAPAVLAIGQQQTTNFRSGVDLIAVDVEVVDKNGAPMAGLDASQFQVTLDGKPRKIASADFVRAETSTSSSTSSAIGAPAGLAASPVRPRLDGQIYILAFDTMSFDPLAIAPAREAARAFVERLQPTDRVGFVAFPTGPIVNPTVDREPLLKEIDRIVGDTTSANLDPYHLVPSEIVDLSRALPPPARNPWDVEQKIRNICQNDRDPETCFREIVPIGHMAGMMGEMEISQRLGALQSLFRSLGAVSTRKVVVLISAGLMTSDRGGGRPDFGDIGRMVGQSAAEANCQIYALFFDRLRSDLMSASVGRTRQYEFARDSAILAQGLDRISGSAGGTFFNIIQGGGEFAFDRILKETSAYYLLGVEPTTGDRDGRPHEVRVKVSQRGVMVRSRSWVALPKPVRVLSEAANEAPAIVPPSPRPLPESVRPIADAYARKDYAAVDGMVAKIPDLANALRDFSDADAPWSETPHRWQGLTLELALAGLADTNAYARDNGLKLLTKTHLMVERSADTDIFPCAWFLAEAAGLEGLWRPDLGLPFVERASKRCPAEARLPLAHGVILEQALAREPGSVTPDEILAAYDSVDAQAEAAQEARVRAAWLAYRRGDIDGARRRLSALSDHVPDPYVHYIASLIAGHIRRAQGDQAAAEQSYRRALDISAGAQSARVALMTLLIAGGASSEAAALAEGIQTAGRDAIDPWWSYSSGDFRSYPSLIARLREIGR